MKCRYFALGLVGFAVSAIASCSSPKDKLIGKWQDVTSPKLSLDFLADGKVIYNKEGKLASWERSGVVSKWEIIEGDRISIDGRTVFKYKIDGNTLILGDLPNQLKYARVK